jgi:hypothetical protein
VEVAEAGKEAARRIDESLVASWDRAALVKVRMWVEARAVVAFAETELVAAGEVVSFRH